MADLKVTQPDAPVTFLFCHAIELYLKAYLRGEGNSPEDLRKKLHRVADLAKWAAKAGLDISQECSEIISNIQDAAVAIEARYIVTGFKTIPANEAFSMVSEQLDQSVCSALAKLGHPVRSETFSRPRPPRREELSEDSVKVLIYIFGTDGPHHVGGIAKALEMKDAVLQYHLDRLADAGFAETAGFNYRLGHVYWTLTSDGRQYVVESLLAEEPEAI